MGIALRTGKVLLAVSLALAGPACTSTPDPEDEIVPTDGLPIIGSSARPTAPKLQIDEDLDHGTAGGPSQGETSFVEETTPTEKEIMRLAKRIGLRRVGRWDREVHGASVLGYRAGKRMVNIFVCLASMEVCREGGDTVKHDLRESGIGQGVMRYREDHFGTVYQFTCGEFLYRVSTQDGETYEHGTVAEAKKEAKAILADPICAER